MVTIDSYGEENCDDWVGIHELHPSEGVEYSAYGQSFINLSEIHKITSAKFYLRKGGSPIGNAHAVLYAHSGVFGTSSVPTGEPLATSDDFDVSTLTGDLQLITFTFTGVEQYEMQADENYCIIYENPETGTIDMSNYVGFGYDSMQPTHDGNISRFNESDWNVYTNDGVFYVYGEDIVLEFGDVIRSALFPGSDDSRGIGGTASKIWATDTQPADLVCELSIVDFSIVRSAAALGSSPGDIGGDENKIWYKALGPDTVHELSTVDFSSIRNQATPGRGVGGKADVIWHSDFDSQEIDELSTTDFSIVRSEDAPGGQAVGIGGSSSKIWHVNYTDYKLWELSPTDFSVVRSADAPAGPWGVGGDSSTIWLNADIAHTVYELWTEEVEEPEESEGSMFFHRGMTTTIFIGDD